MFNQFSKAEPGQKIMLQFQANFVPTCPKYLLYKECFFLEVGSRCGWLAGVDDGKGLRDDFLRRVW